MAVDESYKHEDVILAVVRDVLNDDEIAIEDNFFSAGGDSMISLQVIECAADHGLVLEVADVLTTDSLRELAACAQVARVRVEGTRSDSSQKASITLELPPGADNIRPASDLQVGMLFLTEMAGQGTGTYIDFCGIRVTGVLDRAPLQMALDQVVDRHETLRSYFDLAEYPVAVQIVVPRVQVLPEISIVGRNGDPAEVIAKWRAHVVEEGVDTSAPPSLRCHVVEASDHFWLTLATHHSMMDGWSFHRLMVDLVLSYDAALGGGVAELPAVPSGRGADFVQLEQAAIASIETQQFWQQQTTPDDVWGDRSDVATATCHISFSLSADTWTGLKQTAAALRVPVKSLCLAAHARATGRWRGRPEVVTGLVTNGRPEIDGADLLVGLFLNTVPVRLPADGDWEALARAALAAERTMSPYRRYPLAHMTSARSGALFDVTFNFTHFHLVGELDRLKHMIVDSWWTEDLATFPIMVDVFTEDPMLGTGAMVSYDPQHLSESQAQSLADELQSALIEASTLTVDSYGN